jgi:hypothetical protein
VLGGVAVGREFEPQSDLEHFFAEILRGIVREFPTADVLPQVELWDFDANRRR